jgi:hypothetical protein
MIPSVLSIAFMANARDVDTRIHSFLGSGESLKEVSNEKKNGYFSSAQDRGQMDHSKAVHDGDDDKWAKRSVQEKKERMTERLDDVLSPEKREQYQQYLKTFDGAYAAPEAVKLTDEQKQAIKERKEAGKANREEWKKSLSAEPEECKKLKEQYDNVQNLLTKPHIINQAKNLNCPFATSA